VGDNKDILVSSTSPRAIRESQGGNTIILAIRTPEALRRAHPPAEALPLPPPVWRLLPKELSAPPASTAPPRLAGEEGRGKRRRVYTLKKAISVQQGDINESQTSKLQKP
jgi:rhodanese-related sulfurtransferase